MFQTGTHVKRTESILACVACGKIHPLIYVAFQPEMYKI